MVCISTRIASLLATSATGFFTRALESFVPAGDEKLAVLRPEGKLKLRRDIQVQATRS